MLVYAEAQFLWPLPFQAYRLILSPPPAPGSRVPNIFLNCFDFVFFSPQQSYQSLPSCFPSHISSKLHIAEPQKGGWEEKRHEKGNRSGTLVISGSQSTAPQSYLHSNKSLLSNCPHFQTRGPGLWEILQKQDKVEDRIPWI